MQHFQWRAEKNSDVTAVEQLLSKMVNLKALAVNWDSIPSSSILRYFPSKIKSIKLNVNKTDDNGAEIAANLTVMRSNCDQLRTLTLIISCHGGGFDRGGLFRRALCNLRSSGVAVRYGVNRTIARSDATASARDRDEGPLPPRSWVGVEPDLRCF